MIVSSEAGAVKSEDPPVSVRIQTQDRYKLSLPILIALTVTNKSDNPLIVPSGLDILDPHRKVTFNLISVDGAVFELRRPSGNNFYSLGETSMGPLLVENSSFGVRESRRYLLDLQDFAPEDGIPAGKFYLEIIVYSSPDRVAIRQMGPQVVFEKLTDQDELSINRIRKEVAPEVHYRPSKAVLLYAVEGELESVRSKVVKMNTGFYLYWADAVNGNTIDHSSAENLVSLVQPEMRVIRYELLLREKDTFRSEMMRESILLTYPELAWRLDEADKDRGFLWSGESWNRKHQRRKRR
jgi:hypothetical protein